MSRQSNKHYEKIRGKHSPRYTGYEDISGKFWATLKQSARLRNVELTITIQEAWELFLHQNKKCALTGLELTLPESYRSVHASYWTASLDRINSDEGYTKENCQWVHKDVNLCKQGYTQEYFIRLCNLIANKHARTNLDLSGVERGRRYGKNCNRTK